MSSKEYHKQYHKEWYKRNKEARKKQIHARSKLLRDWYRVYKKTLSCSKCPESDWRCLDFHHKDARTKKFTIASFFAKGVSLETLKKEIAKCEVLCANCHRKETHSA